jgi:hypothetical protein
MPSDKEIIEDLAARLDAAEARGADLERALRDCANILTVCDPTLKRGLLAGEALVMQGVISSALRSPKDQASHE